MSVFAVRRSEDPVFKELDLDTLDIAPFSPDEIELDDILKFEEANISMKQWWPEISCSFYDEVNDQDKGIPDISPWWGSSLLLSRKAYNYLKDSIESLGELLPLTVSDEPYFIFNCLTYGIDDLANCDSEYQKGERLWVTKLSTRPKEKAHIVFKSEYERGNTLFCTQRFVDIVNQVGLEGLSFDTELIQNIDI